MGQPLCSSPRLRAFDWLSTTLVARGDTLSVDAAWLIRTDAMPHTTSSEMQKAPANCTISVLSPAAVKGLSLT